MNKANIKIPSCIDCKNDSNIFCTLSRDEKDELGSNKVNNFYKKGQTIFYEGNQSHGLFCVYSGKIKLSRANRAINEFINECFTTTGEYKERSFDKNPSKWNCGFCVYRDDNELCGAGMHL